MGRLYIPEMFEEEVTFEQASFHFRHWRKGDDLLEKLTEFQDFYDLTICVRSMATSMIVMIGIVTSSKSGAGRFATSTVCLLVFQSCLLQRRR